MIHNKVAGSKIQTMQKTGDLKSECTKNGAESIQAWLGKSDWLWSAEIWF